MINKNKLQKQTLAKYQHLESLIKGYSKAVVAFSGGIDSTLLSFVTHHILAQNSLIITVNSEFISDCELEESKFLANKYNFNHKIINLSVMDFGEITQNSPLRCKFCKEIVFQEIIKVAEQNDISTIFDGSNTDDLKDYRPGFEAIKKLAIKSPFIEASISKKEIREIAQACNIPNWNKPAMACLASRVPYNTTITTEILTKVELAENYLNQLGYTGSRVRHHDSVARIELNPEQISDFISNHRESVDSELKKLGYNYVCLDLNGYKTGSLNQLVI